MTYMARAENARFTPLARRADASRQPRHDARTRRRNGAPFSTATRPQVGACESIIGGTFDAALAAGADLILWPRPGIWNQRGAMDKCRFFDVPVVSAHGSNADAFLADPPRLFWPVVVGGEDPDDGDTERVDYGPGLELDVRCADGRHEQSWAVAEAAGVYAALLRRLRQLRSTPAPHYGQPRHDPESAPTDAATARRPDATARPAPRRPSAARRRARRRTTFCASCRGRARATSEHRFVTGVMGFTPVSYVVGPALRARHAIGRHVPLFGYDDARLDLRTRYQDGSLSAPVTIGYDTGLPPVVQPSPRRRAGRVRHRRHR